MATEARSRDGYGLMGTADYAGHKFLGPFGHTGNGATPAYPAKEKCSRCGVELAPQKLWRLKVHDGPVLLCSACREQKLRSWAQA